MRTLTRSILAATSVLGLLAVPGMAMGEDNSTSFTVEANSTALSVANDSSAVTLADGGSPLLALQAGTVSGALPQTTVTDERGTVAATWAVSVVATSDWESNVDDDGDGVPDATVANTAGRAYLDATDLTDLTTNLLTLDGMEVTGAELVGDVTGNNLGTSYTLIEGSTLLGNGSVVYTPIVEVDVPADTPAGTYTATVQQTVS